MLLPGVILAGEAQIIALSGAVDVRLTREGQWTSAKEKMEIPEGGAIRTGAKGAAVALMPNKTKIWLKESSSLEIEQRQTLSSRLMLVFGNMKVRVPHLMRREKFEVRNPVAICAVRGTEFTMSANEEGKMDVKVLYGEVKLKFTVPPQKGAAEFNIPQGQGLSSAESGKAAKPVLLTAKSEREALENWNPGLKPEERQKELQEKENDRAQVKDFARATTKAENSVKSFLNIVKESDLEAGRTLTDVHGNVVRVDQRMIRPDASTIQFMNLVKRPVYANYAKATKGFMYNGGAVANRLDLAQMSMGFNKALPSRIEEWPSFFNGNEVNPTFASFILANRTNASDIFFVAEGYRYDATRDELVDNLSVLAPGRTWAVTSPYDKHTMIAGVLADNTGTAVNEAQEMLNALSRLEIRDSDLIVSGNSSNGLKLQYKSGSTYVNMNGIGATDVKWGMAVDQTPTSGHNYDYSASGDNAPLANFRADAYAIGNDMTGTTANQGIMWYAREDYVINNGGGIRTADSITNSAQDPFSLLKNLAAESVVYVKQSNSNDTAGIISDITAYDDVKNADWFGGRNIDVVIIPDLFVAGIQRMLPAFTKLGD